MATQNVGDFAPQPQHQFVVSDFGAACDSLALVSIQWHAFSENEIVVHVQNNNFNQLFDYPNFILFDANNDTLAVETVNFFGIAGDSWHMLQVNEGAIIPDGQFTGMLELWTLGTTVLACEWTLPMIRARRHPAPHSYPPSRIWVVASRSAPTSGPSSTVTCSWRAAGNSNWASGWNTMLIPFA
ncbi:MAG: hypothetical protein IPO90_01870 [Flavobacteriales bacterium]|nr:hypothetical protein [Flavobacteriales bacterium]